MGDGRLVVLVVLVDKDIGCFHGDDFAHRINDLPDAIEVKAK